MATERRARPTRNTGSMGSKRTVKSDGFFPWALTIVGGVLLIAAGFSSGVLLGVLTEEPQLVTGHLAGRSQSVPWTIAAEPTKSGREQEAVSALRAEAVASPSRVAVGEPVVNDAPVAPAPVARAPADGSALPAVAAAPPSGFAIQVGAFSSSEAAREMIAKLKRQGYKSYVAAGAAARDGRWRVRIGPFSTRDAADSKAAEIKREHQLPTWVLSEEG